MRKSIALFLTLIFITSLMAIIAAIFSIYQKFSNDTFYKDISQKNILIKNIKSILNNLSKDINGSIIKTIFTTIPISNKNGDFHCIIKISPIHNKININQINNQYIDKYLENILEYYNVLDPIFFKNLILDTLDLDKKERSGGSEIILKNSFFKQGRIYNYNHFKEILDYYANFTNDKNIYKIPWKKLIFFGNENSIIDCNIINNSVAKFLGLKFNNNIDCKNIKIPENRNLIENLNIKPFNKNDNYLIKITIFYKKSSIELIYNLSSKKIVKINNKIQY